MKRTRRRVATSRGLGSRRRASFVTGVLLTLAVGGCTALQQIVNLRDVDFFLDGTSAGRLAGVPIDRLSRFEDLRPSDLVQLAQALADGRLPLSFTLHVGVSNPASNGVAASLLALDWRLMIDDRETVSGRVTETTPLEPGQVSDLPVPIRLDLLRFFEDDLRELVDVALDAAGEDGEGASLRLLVRPTLQTPLGPIEFPDEITITRR